MSKELIRLQNLVMEFDGERILDDINLYFNDHEFLTLLGQPLVLPYLDPGSREAECPAASLYHGGQSVIVRAYPRAVPQALYRSILPAVYPGTMGSGGGAGLRFL